MAARFDLDRLEIVGQPTSVAPGVVTSHAYGTSYFDLSSTGTLVYWPGKPEDEYSKLTWVDRSGKSEPFDLTRNFGEVRFSPNATKVAFRERKGNDDIWSYDLARGTLTRVTTRWDNGFIAWAPDGRSLFYNAITPGAGIVRKAADGSGPEEVLLPVTSSDFAVVDDVSADGQQLLYSIEGDIWNLPLAKDRAPSVLIDSEFREGQARFSPDTQWIAYTSNESGHDEIYIQPYPGPGSRTLVSTRGGHLPAWRGDGRELFFYGGGAIQSVAIQTEPELEIGAPVVLFEREHLHRYDVTPDGRRFLILENDPTALSTEVHVIVNWFDELNRLVPPD